MIKTNRFAYFIAVFLSFSSQAVASQIIRASDVCVRNFFPEGANMNPCADGSGMFRKVVSAQDENQSICTKIYEERLCQVSPQEYRYVETADHQMVCTVNFHQEGIAEYCDSHPKVFSWARGL